MKIVFILGLVYEKVESRYSYSIKNNPCITPLQGNHRYVCHVDHKNDQLEHCLPLQQCYTLILRVKFLKQKYYNLKELIQCIIKEQKQRITQKSFLLKTISHKIWCIHLQLVHQKPNQYFISLGKVECQPIYISINMNTTGMRSSCSKLHCFF